MMTKVLITGAAGLLGANFSRYLLDRSYEVIGIDNLSGGYLDNVPDGVSFYCEDLLNLPALSSIFEQEKDANCGCLSCCLSVLKPCMKLKLSEDKLTLE